MRVVVKAAAMKSVMMQVVVKATAKAALEAAAKAAVMETVTKAVAKAMAMETVAAGGETGGGNGAGGESAGNGGSEVRLRLSQDVVRDRWRSLEIAGDCASTCPHTRSTLAREPSSTTCRLRDAVAARMAAAAIEAALRLPGRAAAPSCCTAAADGGARAAALGCGGAEEDAPEVMMLTGVRR